MKLTTKIVQLLDEGKNDPSIFKAIFLAGGPGSGKSFVVKKSTLGLGFKLVSSDVIFEKMLEDLGMSKKDIFSDKAKEVRADAKKLNQKRMSFYRESRLGMVIDGTGKTYDTIYKQRKMLSDLGYDTKMIFVETSLDVALERNRERARSMPDDMVEKMWKDVQDNKTKFISLFGSSNFIEVDNSEYSSDKHIFSEVWKGVMKFAKQKVTNPIARKWLDEN